VRVVAKTRDVPNFGLTPTAPENAHFLVDKENIGFYQFLI